MYNEEMKRQFIKSYTKSLHTAESARLIFDALEPYEKGWGADFCTRSSSELQPVLDNILGIRMRSKWSDIIMLREYSKWCMLAEHPGACDGIMGVNTVGLDKIRKQMVASPLHLQRYFDEVFDAESEETLDNIYRCFLWMAYGGLVEEDTLNVKASNVNLSELNIVLNDIEYPLYREAIPAFKNAISLTSFIHRHPKYIKPVRKDRAQGETIMRGIRFNANILTIRAQISKRLVGATKDVIDKQTGEILRQKRTEQSLSYYRIWLSGIFYRMYEIERAGFPVDFSEVVLKEMEGKTYSLNDPSSLVRKRNLKMRDYTEDYQRWKLAFSI